jgi:hypothetical protein
MCVSCYGTLKTNEKITDQCCIMLGPSHLLDSPHRIDVLQSTDSCETLFVRPPPSVKPLFLDLFEWWQMRSIPIADSEVWATVSSRRLVQWGEDNAVARRGGVEGCWW